MKILLISEYFPPKIFGGGEISAGLLAKNLAKKGIDVSVLTSHFKDLKEFEIVDSVKIYRRLITGENPNSFFSNLMRTSLFHHSTKKDLIKLNKKENFDIIHCMNINSILGASKAKSEIENPMIAHINALSLFCPLGTLLKGGEICDEKCSFLKFSECFLRYGKISKMEERWYLRYNLLFIIYVYSRFRNRLKSLKRMDFFIAISNFMKNLLLSQGIHKEKIAVVPNPVEIEKFINLESKEENKIPKILYLGVYEKFKGPQILLKALKNLEDKRFECNLYGSGSLKEELKNMVKDFQIEDRVRINNEVPYIEIPNLYKEHNIVVFPSLWPEPFGRVAIEAMAAEKTVIASKIGGISEIIEDGKDGFLFSPGNINELTKILENLINNPNLRKNIGTSAKESTKRFYSEEKISEEVVKIYEKVKKKNNTGQV